MGEVFVPQPVMRKNLSRIFKIHLRLHRIGLGRRHGKTGKNWQKYGKVVFLVKSGIPDPPSIKGRTDRGVRNLIWTVDLGAHPWAVQMCTSIIYDSGPPPPPPPPPPLVKFRMVRGGPEKLWCVDLNGKCDGLYGVYESAWR
jgi:hypothetical protein